MDEVAERLRGLDETRGSPLMALVRAVVLGLGLTVAAEKVHAGEAPNPALVSTASTAQFMVTERQSVAHSDFLVAHPRAYQLYWDVDVPLVMIGAALALGRQVRMANSSAPAYCVTLAEGCNKSDLNALDRPFAGSATMPSLGSSLRHGPCSGQTTACRTRLMMCS